MGMDNNEVMAGLLGKLYTILTAPDEINQGATDSAKTTFISFCSPGIAVSEPDLTFGDLSTKDQIIANARFSQLTNYIPNPVGFWSMAGDLTWNIYKDAITNVKLPVSELTEKEQKMLQKAENFLVETVTKVDPFTEEQTTTTQPTAAYKAYQNMFSKYQAALATYNDMLINAKAKTASPDAVQRFNLNGPAARQAVVNAYQEWGSVGYREYVQEANGIISNLTGRGPQALYDQLKAAFNMDARTDPVTGEVYYTTLYFPEGVLTPRFAQSWQTFTFAVDQSSEYAEQSAVSWGGGVQGSYGLFSAGASAAYSKEQSHSHADTSGMRISVELTQVPLLRSWWSPWIFKSHGWDWDKSAGFGPVSNGETPPQGLMPIFPTQVILARNLQVDMDMTSKDNTSFMESIKTETAVGFGPFSLRGNYAHTQSRSTHDFTASQSGISCPGPQIIGFICEMLPKSPDPDPNLNWP